MSALPDGKYQAWTYGKIQSLGILASNPTAAKNKNWHISGNSNPVHIYIYIYIATCLQIASVGLRSAAQA
jgi:hypothetical protein